MTLQEAADILKRGGLVAFPTETVYGLGADAWNAKAIEQLFKLKGRPVDNPLIVHLSEIGQATEFACNIPAAAEQLMENCWPGPLTLVLQKRENVLDLITAALPTVAIRLPDHELARQLIRLSGPLVAPSANRSGRPSPTRAEHVRFDFGPEFPVLDGGSCQLGLESTVLDLSDEPYTLLRPGRYTAGELSTLSGCRITARSRDDTTGPARSPGMKYTHYKPEAGVVWFNPDAPPEPSGTLLITHRESGPGEYEQIHFAGDYDTFAARLYDLFRTADHRSFRTIAIEPIPPDLSHPMIPALRNRIDKAAGLN